MTRTEYIAEALAEAAEDIGLKLTSAQFGQLAEAADHAADYWREYASPPVAAPVHDEIRTLRAKYERDIAEYKALIEQYHNEAARHANVDPASVTLSQYGRLEWRR